MFFFFFSEFVEQNIFVAQVQQYKEVSSDFSARIWSSRSLAVLNKGECLLGFLTWKVTSIIFSFLLVLTLKLLFTLRTEESGFESESRSESLRGVFGQEMSFS